VLPQTPSWIKGWAPEKGKREGEGWRRGGIGNGGEGTIVVYGSNPFQYNWTV